MPKRVTVPAAMLELDLGNPRLPTDQSDQQEMLVHLVKNEKAKVMGCAADIAEWGMDPLSSMAVSVVHADSARRTVLEGNRRLAALLILENPSRVSAQLASKEVIALDKLAAKFRKRPVTALECVEFETDEWRHWVQLKHTGENKGAGVVSWGTDEQDRFLSRDATRRPAGQVIDFLRDMGHDVNSADGSVSYASTLERMINTPEVRAPLGVTLTGGRLQLTHTPESAARALGHVVEQLRTGALKVGKVMTREQRLAYVKRLPAAIRVQASERLPAAAPLAASAVTRPPARPTAAKNAKKQPLSENRKRLIPPRLVLSINVPKINRLYQELQKANVRDLTNLCAVGLRVFVELSVDAYIDRVKLKGHPKLAQRMQMVAADLLAKGEITDQVHKSVNAMTQRSTDPLVISTFEMNQYVHNLKFSASPLGLLHAWDALEDFLVALWP